MASRDGQTTFAAYLLLRLAVVVDAIHAAAADTRL